MKWNLPKEGSRRIRKKWAWYPVTLDKIDPKDLTTKVWLETYYVYEFVSWNGNWHSAVKLSRYDAQWIDSGTLSTNSQYVRTNLGVK